MTDDEREEVLQLLANYENMARAVETFLQRMRMDPQIDLKADRYRPLVADLLDVVPVWKQYAAAVRVKLSLERRESSVPPALERRRSSEYL